MRFARLLVPALLVLIVVPSAQPQQATAAPGLKIVPTTQNGKAGVLLMAANSGDPSRQGQSNAQDFHVIQHIVFIVKENRSFDSMFGTFPGADGATTGLMSTGQVVQLGQMPDGLPRDIGHSWGDTLDAMDYGKMDGFDLILENFFQCNLRGDMLCFTQYQQKDIQNYWN